MRPASLALAALLVSACAHPKPVLYPDERYKAAGQERADADTAACRADAKKYVKANWKKPVGRRTAWGAATGAVMGVVSGLILGDIGRAAASGAAVGSVAGAASGAAEASSPDAVERAYTERCLSEKGYSVLGWR